MRSNRAGHQVSSCGFFTKDHRHPNTCAHTIHTPLTHYTYIQPVLTYVGTALSQQGTEGRKKGITSDRGSERDAVSQTWDVRWEDQGEEQKQMQKF